MTIPIKCLKFPYFNHLFYLGVLIYFNYLTVIVDNTDFLLIIGRRAKNEKKLLVISKCHEIKEYR